MIYYPNKYERYTAALRLIYHKLMMRNGITENRLKSIRKIYEFEALNNRENRPINIEKYLSEILTAVFLKKKFDFNINVKENRILNLKLLTALILRICTKGDYIVITETDKKVLIRCKILIDGKIKIFTENLGGIILKERKTGSVLLILNLPVTKKKSEDFEAAYYLLQNPLSVINFYLI